MTRSHRRSFTTPQPGEDWTALALRVFPQEPADATIEKLRSWNLHLLMRIPPGQFLGSDVIFVEPPLAARDGGG